MNTKLQEALADLRAAIYGGQDRQTAIAETAEFYGLRPELLDRFTKDMPVVPLPSALPEPPEPIERKAVRLRNMHTVGFDALTGLGTLTERKAAARRELDAMADDELAEVMFAMARMFRKAVRS